MSIMIYNTEAGQSQGWAPAAECETAARPGRALRDGTHRQVPLDIADHKEGVVMEVMDDGCAAPQLCRPPIPLRDRS